MSVRQPLWIINSVLLSLFGFGLGLILIWQPVIPKPTSITPKPVILQPKNIAPINPKSIYENDLFKTHISEISNEDINELTGLPNPPEYQDFKPKKNIKPAFMEALPITITGIMVFADELDNRAIIMDNRSKIETIYKVGDDLEDAQIIRILRNRTVIVRSNGQQETLFLREQDAIKELEIIEPDWGNIITKVDSNNYQINLEEFTNQVKSLSQVLDALNLITAYRDGQAIGVKVGNESNNMLINLLGLKPNDILSAINDIDLGNVDQRVLAYQNIIDPTTPSIVLKLIRQKEPLTVTYQLRPNLEPTDLESTDNVSDFESLSQKINLQDLENASTFKNKISQSVEVKHEEE